MEAMVIIAIIGLTLVSLAQTYLILQLNVLYKSKDLAEYVTLTEKPAKAPKETEPEEVEVERYP